MRKEHPLLRLENQLEVSKRLQFIENVEVGLPEPVLAWIIDGENAKDDWKKVLIIANPIEQNITYQLDGQETWKCITDGCTFEPEEKFITGGEKINIKPKTVAVFAQFRR
jgi:hypothetical protein